jgi:adenine-specific DNA glycosylase
LDLVLLENIAYLTDDRRREQAFVELQQQVGTLPHQILAASDEALVSVTAHGILGATGAEKILLLARSHPVLGLDSNGMRVLTRIGMVKEEPSYAATYRNVQSFVSIYADKGFDWLIRAHHLLRQHGQELCKRSRPRCDRCPLNDECNYIRRLTSDV